MPYDDPLKYRFFISNFFCKAEKDVVCWLFDQVYTAQICLFYGEKKLQKPANMDTHPHRWSAYRKYKWSMQFAGFYNTF